MPHTAAFLAGRSFLQAAGPMWHRNIELVSSVGTWKETVWTGPSMRSLGHPTAYDAGGQGVSDLTEYVGPPSRKALCSVSCFFQGA